MSFALVAGISAVFKVYALSTLALAGATVLVYAFRYFLSIYANETILTILN